MKPASFGRDLLAPVVLSVHVYAVAMAWWEFASPTRSSAAELLLLIVPAGAASLSLAALTQVFRLRFRVVPLAVTLAVGFILFWTEVNRDALNCWNCRHEEWSNGTYALLWTPPLVAVTLFYGLLIGASAWVTSRALRLLRLTHPE